MFKIWRKPTKGEVTVIFTDTAEGGDYSAMVAFSKKHLDAFMSYHGKTPETKIDIGSAQLGNEAYKMCKHIYSYTNSYPWIAVERNLGQATLARLLALEYTRIFKINSSILLKSILTISPPSPRSSLVF